MDTKLLINSILVKHQEFGNTIKKMTCKEYTHAENEKWTPGQHLDHLWRSIKPINDGLVFPFFMLKLKLGTTKRASQSFEEVVANYKASLDKGGKASGNFVPKQAPCEDKEALLEKFDKTASQLCKRLAKLNDKQIDSLLIPHPLLGKITLRELLYFTLYHVEHHQKIVLKV